MKRRLRQAAQRWRDGDEDAIIAITRTEFRQLRPSRHPIVLGLWLAFGIVSILQLARGVSPDSVNVALEFDVQRALAGLVVLGVALNLVAPWIPSDKVSLAGEIGGVILCGTAFTVYALVIAGTREQWYLTSGAAWSFGMLAGTAGRAVQIFRRGW